VVSLLVIIAVLGTDRARAQDMRATACNEKSPPDTAELTKAILHQIQSIETRMVTIAEDFPGDLHNTYRPKGDEDVRSAAEILLHVAQQNAEVAFEISNQEGQKAMAAAGNIADAKTFVYVSKQETVIKVKDSFAAVRKAIQDNPEFFGAVLLGWIKIPALYGEKRFQGTIKQGALRSLLMGLAFAFGWTPCVGPVLAAMLMLASTQNTVARGTALLGVYSAGLAVPFLLVALGTSRFVSLYRRWSRHLIWVERFAGILLVVVGGLVFFDQLQELSTHLWFFARFAL
jgi:phosphotransferase system HPr-like phosphotransfer protein